MTATALTAFRWKRTASWWQWHPENSWHHRMSHSLRNASHGDACLSTQIDPMSLGLRWRFTLGFTVPRRWRWFLIYQCLYGQDVLIYVIERKFKHKRDLILWNKPSKRLKFISVTEHSALPWPVSWSERIPANFLPVRKSRSRMIPCSGWGLAIIDRSTCWLSGAVEFRMPWRLIFFRIKYCSAKLKSWEIMLL